MDTVAPVGRGFPLSRNKGGNVFNSLASGIRASDVAQHFVSKAFSWCIIVCGMFIFATSHFSKISAQNFSVESTAYDCSSNIICLADAHVYQGSNNNNGIQAGRLSLLNEQNSSLDFKLGIAYYNQSVKLLDRSTHQSASFNTSFVVNTVWNQISECRGGDGMAFLLSADNLATASGGGNFGVFNAEGITTFKSIVVEFDTHQNPTAPMFDINDNHVSFDFSNMSFKAVANASAKNIDLGAELTMYAWVEYSNETGQLEVRVSNRNSRPMVPLLNYPVDLFDVAEENMWVGFASGSGELHSNNYIGDWTFQSYGIPESTPESTGTARSRKRLLIILGIFMVVPVFLLASIVIVLIVQRGSGGIGGCRDWLLGWRASREEDTMVPIEGMPERFSYKQLSKATDAFNETSKLGEGTFGSVYRGVLPSSGIQVAVKKMNGNSFQGEKEFIAEVSIISRLRHRNLIQLLGWSEDASKGKYLLVYELMPNGSLDKVLFGPTESQMASPSWPQRFNIVTGTAAALDYLHKGWKQQVIHRDIKPSNIMLDEEWNAKLGDFGLARLVDHQREPATTRMAGTFGYLAPEIITSGKYTTKSDVFAFGVVVLEVACGRRALSSNVPEDDMVLVDWVWQRLSEGDLMCAVDKRLGDYDTYWMEVLLKVGLLCSHPNPVVRPSIRHVVQVLAGDVPVPSIPASKPDFSSESRQGFSTDQLLSLISECTRES